MAEMTPYQEDIRQLYVQGLNLDALQGHSLLVAGATGLVGACVVDIAMADPHRNLQVFAAGRNRRRAEKRFAAYANDPRFSFVEIDVTQPIVGETPYDYIIDAASNASPNFFKQQPVEVIKANIDGVAHLLDYGRQHGLRKMVYVSSGEIYGQGDGHAFTETSSGYVDCATPRACYPSSKRAAETPRIAYATECATPRACYPSSKRAAETLCIAYATEYATPVTIARLCHTYGPGFTESDNRVFAQFFRNVLRGEDIVLKSRGEQYRSWLYVVDSAHALLHLLFHGESAQAYNVADAKGNITIRQLAEQVAAWAKRKVVFDIPATADQGNTTPVTRATFDTSKIEHTGWKPLFDISTGLNHSLETLKER